MQLDRDRKSQLFDAPTSMPKQCCRYTGMELTSLLQIDALTSAWEITTTVPSVTTVDKYITITTTHT